MSRIFLASLAKGSAGRVRRIPSRRHFRNRAYAKQAGNVSALLGSAFRRLLTALPRFGQEEKSAWVCGSFAPPLILLLSIALTFDGFTSSDKYAIVVSLLGLVPLASAWLNTRATQHWLPSALDFLRLNLAFTLLGSLWITARLWIAALPDFNPRLLAIAYLATIVMLCVRGRTEGRPQNNVPVDLTTLLLLGATPAVFVTATMLSGNWHIPSFSALAGTIGAVLAIGLLWVWQQQGRSFFRDPRATRWVAHLVMLAAPLAMMDGELDYDALHYTAYLGPATAVAAGRIPLIDVFCQYGQSYLVYLLAFNWLPWTYGSAALVTSIVNLAYTICYLIILRRMVKHEIAFVALAVALPFFFWLIYHYAPNMTPSQGGMRYLPVAVLCASLVWLPAGRWFSATSISAVLLCWAWSFEAALFGTFVYVAFASASVAVESINVPAKLISIAKFLSLLAALLLGFVLAVAGAYLILTAELPRYDLYVSMVFAYVGTDPFMQYSFYEPGFLAWVAVLVMLVPVPCLIAQRFFQRDSGPPDMLPQFAVVWAMACVASVYCLISTQGFILKVAAMAIFVFLCAAMDRALRPRESGTVSVSGVALAPVFVILAFFLSGTTIPNFGRPAAYASPNTSLLRQFVSSDRHFLSDASRRLRQTCSPEGVLELGNVCTGYQELLPLPRYKEFVGIVKKWQDNQQELLIFHPVDTILSTTFRKPHVLPFSLSYTDGFSPALFEYILRRAEPVISEGLRPGQTLVAARDFSILNDLQWALLKRIADVWALERIEETENFAVYRLAPKTAGPSGPRIALPDRPVKTRNSF